MQKCKTCGQEFMNHLTKCPVCVGKGMKPAIKGEYTKNKELDKIYVDRGREPKSKKIKRK